MSGRLPAPATDGERRSLTLSLVNGLVLVPLCLNGVNRPGSPLRVLHGAGLVLAVFMVASCGIRLSRGRRQRKARAAANGDRPAI